MKIASDALEAVAATLVMDYSRTMTMTEADISNHYRKTTLPLMIYNGPSDIAIEFEGAQIIDVIACEVFFLVKMTTKDMLGDEVDELLEITKRLADKTYAELNTDTIVAKDILPYTLEAVEVMTDMFVGHKMIIGLPFYNEGC